jgi:hypothetical protein
MANIQFIGGEKGGVGKRLKSADEVPSHVNP